MFSFVPGCDLNFDQIWHEGFIHVIWISFPKSKYIIFRFWKSKYVVFRFCKKKSKYIVFRFCKFKIKPDDNYFYFEEVKAGVSQGSVIGSMQYLLYTSDILLQLSNDTVFNSNIVKSINKKELASNQVLEWITIKFDEAKLNHINFNK